jgi:hypothetical protein
MNDSRFLIGVAGSMQTGKIEMGPTWSRLGATFIDLNPDMNAARLKHRAELDAIGLGGAFEADGREGAVFYRRVLADSALHHAAMEIVLPSAAQAIKERLQGERTGTLILSGGYLHRLFRYGITVDQVVIFQSARPIWIERIKRRAEQIGLTGMTDDDVERIARILDRNPDSIEHEVSTAYHGRWTKFDTSDYGIAEANLSSLLSSLIE